MERVCSPLHKVDTPSQHQDFRGININPVIARCFEKIVHHKFSNHAFEENLSKCKELVLKKKGQANPSPIGYIEQAEFIGLLGVTFQGNGRLTEHIKRKLFEVNKCLYV